MNSVFWKIYLQLREKWFLPVTLNPFGIPWIGENIWNKVNVFGVLVPDVKIQPNLELIYQLWIVQNVVGKFFLQILWMKMLHLGNKYILLVNCRIFFTYIFLFADVILVVILSRLIKFVKDMIDLLLNWNH